MAEPEAAAEACAVETPTAEAVPIPALLDCATAVAAPIAEAVAVPLEIPWAPVAASAPSAEATAEPALEA
jgi:hypothetical protein